MYNLGYKTKTVKHCTNYTWLYIVTCHIKRYKCKICNHRFYEPDTFSNPHECLSKESIYAILDRLKLLNETFESVASSFHISRQEVIYIFDKYVDYRKPVDLPVIMSWDEKSKSKNMGKDPYMFIIVDFLKNKIYDILESRKKNSLTSYFSKIPLEIRNKVEFITMDMWPTYLDLAELYFRNAKIAIDSFHIVKNISHALDQVRLNVMRKFNNGAEDIEDNHIYYYMLKKYKYILLSDFDELDDKVRFNRKLKSHLDKHMIRRYLLDIDDNLKKAYYLYIRYLEFNKTCTYQEACDELEILIDDYFNSCISHFIEVAKTLTHWKEYILNSFILVDSLDGSTKRRLSNGPIEGINSMIEKININGNGYTNFSRFKRRVIYVINKDVALKALKRK